MKKTIYFSLLLILIFSANTFAQMASIAITPQNQCFNGFSNSGTANVSTPITGATSYSWAIVSPSCMATFTTLSPGTNSAISISYPCCGTYTIQCMGWNGAIPIGSATQTTSIHCSSVSVTPNTTAVCLGSSVFLMASGASSYTWSASSSSFTSNSPSISVTPTVNTYYFLFGTNSAGCTDSAFAYVAVTPASPIFISGNTSICAGSSTTLTATGAQSYTWQPGSMTGAGIVVSPSVTTCYTVTGSSPGGCVVSTVKCVTVQPGSSVTVTGPNTICSGSFALLQASGGTSYTWMPGGSNSSSIVVTPTTTTCYTLLSQGCSGPVSIVKCVIVNPTPVLSLSGDLSVCPGDTTTITVSGANNYTWTQGSFTFTGSTMAFLVTSTTCFSIVGTTGNGCVGVTGACINTQGGNVNVSGPTSSICAGSSATLTASGMSTYTWQPGNLTGSSIVVSPTAMTCYTVIGSSPSGCTGSAIKCVSVQTTPNIHISGTSFICAGDSTMLVASGGLSYTWQPGNIVSNFIVVSPTSTTCYTLTGVGTCSTLGSDVHCITVQPSNSLTISGPSSICLGGSALLIASGSPFNYTWSPGGAISPSIVVSPTATTCYTATAVGCSGNQISAVKCIVVSFTSGVAINGPSSICAGSSAILTAMGGSGSFTWSPGGSTSSSIAVSPTTTTCYTVTSFGCSGLVSAVKCISVSPGSSLSISGPNSICSGSYAILQASGGTSYTWMPGGLTSSSIIVSPSVTTCYTLSGMGCSGLSSVVKCVTVNPTPVISASGNLTICPGNGATITASGANTYTWLTASGTFTGSTVVLTPSATTCFSLIGQNSAGCIGVTGVCIIVQPSQLVVSGPNSICPGSGATLTASGGSSYTWQPGGFNGSSIVVTPSVSTCYTVFSSGNCGSGSAVKCVSVTSGNNITITSSGNSLCPGSSATLIASGAGNYTWQPGGATGNAVIVTPTATTCYTVTGLSCSGLTSAVTCITVNPNPVLTITGNTAVCAGSSTTLTASGASSYTWFGTSTFTGSTIVITPLTTTCFSLMGMSSNGCLGFSGICITPQGALSVSGNTSICSGSSTTLTASGAQSYTWQPGNLTGASIVVSPTATTCYTVFGSNPLGCNGSAVRCVQVNPKPIINTFPTSTLCLGQPGGLMATGATSYTWLPYNLTGSTIAITPTTSACYTVIGTNSFGCTNTAVSCYSAFPSVNVTISGPNVNCTGQTTTLTASGGVNYVWQPGNISGASIVVSPTASTCYTVTGFGGFNCPGTAVRCMSVQPGPTLTIGGNTSICAGSSASLVANGALTYTWIPGNLTGAVVVVSPSVSTCYTVVGANANGCIGVSNICVQVKPKPIIATSGGIFCANQSDSLFASGASTYTWLPFNYVGPIIMITPSVSGCYTVVGTNSVGCTNSVVGCYSVMPSPVITVSGNSVICAGGSSTLTASGGSNYFWLPGGQTGPSIVVSPSVTTCYTVSSTNAFGCTTKFLKCVIVQPGASINISGNSLICAGSCANLLASGANTYTWSNGSNSPFITVCPTVSTCYTLSGTTSQGCIGTAVKCIQVQPQPFISITGNTVICQGSSTSLMASGASSYSWSTGSTANNITVAPSVNTTYYVTGTNGICSATRSVNVIVKPRPNIMIMRTDSSSFHDSIVCAGELVTLTAIGGISYTWSTGSPFSTIIVSPTVTTAYTVTGTGANSCTNGDVYVVIVSPCTGITQHSANTLKIGVYPNPSPGHIILQHDGSATVNYAVYDVIGREIVKGEFSGSKELDLSGYANGTYLIRFGSGPETFYKKLVLEK